MTLNASFIVICLLKIRVCDYSRKVFVQYLCGNFFNSSMKYEPKKEPYGWFPLDSKFDPCLCVATDKILQTRDDFAGNFIWLHPVVHTKFSGWFLCWWLVYQLFESSDERGIEGCELEGQERPLRTFWFVKKTLKIPLLTIFKPSELPRANQWKVFSPFYA